MNEYDFEIPRRHWVELPNNNCVYTSGVQGKICFLFSLDKASNFLESCMMSQEAKQPTTAFIIYGKTLQ